MQRVDWASLATSVALEVLGEPKTKTSTHWRWGNKGSLALSISGEGEGNFYDFENDEPLTCHQFILKHGLDFQKILKSHGYNGFDLDEVMNDKHFPSINVASSRSFDKFQMQNLANEAIIKVQYSPNFWVMRFPNNHYIKQKYAPFTKQEDGSWIMARPEAPLPIYLSEREPEGAVLLVEGEKAMQGAEDLYQGQVCCHHGGVNNWKEGKSDWTPIYGRKVLIWPDNDVPGLKMAVDLKAYLNGKKCQVDIVKIPEDFKDKDDLWDAWAKNYFGIRDRHRIFNDYLKNNLDKSARGSFELISIADMEANIKEPEWLIEKILERETIGTIYGTPKSGKSLISLSMMLAIANGYDWFNYSVKQTPTILFAGEGERSVHKRILAWAKFHDRSIKDNPFRMSNRPARILNDQDFDLIMQTLKNAYSDMGDIGCVCIDTLQRNWGGGDENSSSDMGKFIQRIDEIKYEFNCNIIMVHHSGHVGGKSRARGSSVLPSSVDFEFQVDRKDGTDKDDPRMYTTIKQTLNKEGVDHPPINFEVVPVYNLKGYAAQSSATINLTESIPDGEEDPGNLIAINNAITIIHSEKIHAGEDPFDAMVSISEIVKYLDDEKKGNSWVSKNINLYKQHKSCCWTKSDRGEYQCENLLKAPF